MRYIMNESTNPFFNHAIEAYYLMHTDDDVCLLWRNRPSVLIGRNQNARAEIDTQFVQEHEIDVVRRLSGGGTVFCDLGNINFTFITHKNHADLGFEYFAKPIVAALNDLGIPAIFSGRNDILVDGKKVSGNAQYHYKNRILHHGTLLYQGDLSQLKGALLSRPIKFEGKGVKSVASRVTNISNYLETPMDTLAFKAYLETYLMAYYAIQAPEHPDTTALTITDQIQKERFENYQWNYGQSPPYAYQNAVKFSFGLIECHLNITNGRIDQLEILGDFFGQAPIEALTQRLIHQPYEEAPLLAYLETLDLSPYIAGATPTDLMACLFHNRQQESPAREAKPEWLRRSIPKDNHLDQVATLLSDLNLNTICDQANCPNRMVCFDKKTATFLILGPNCTRHCTFCNVTKAAPMPVDSEEPLRIAKAVKALGLRHAVITSVTRDDLKDQGANQFVQVVKAIRANTPQVTIELLIPDLQGQFMYLDLILESGPDILNHNIETIPRLYATIRPKANYQQSLDLLAYAKAAFPDRLTKSGIMVGLGETEGEVHATLKDLRNHHCDIVTIGQYLPPSKQHAKLIAYIHPDTFKDYETYAYSLGFKGVASGPLVRSSYLAENFVQPKAR